MTKSMNGVSIFFNRIKIKIKNKKEKRKTNEENSLYINWMNKRIGLRM